MVVSVGVAVRTLFSILACVMAAAIADGVIMDGIPSCFNLFHDRWLEVAMLDFFIIFAIISAWTVYKESSWIVGAVFMILLSWVGSVASCGYIVMLFYKLSPEESSQDPLYFVLARHKKGNVTGKIKGPSVVSARVIFTAVGCLILGLFIYALILDGSPFHAEKFSTWCQVATTIDIYNHVAVFSVWIAYKESSWINAFFWILSLVCFRSITLCVYIVRQLFYLSPHQHVSLILFKNNNRNLQANDALLTNDV